MATPTSARFRAGAGKDIGLKHRLAQLHIVQRINAGAGERAYPAGQPQLFADGAGGGGMVAGDHDDADAGRAAGGHRAHRFLARRIGDGRHRQQREAAGPDIGECEIGAVVRFAPHGHRQQPHARRRQPFHAR
jgi:hypothetical protein